MLTSKSISYRKVKNDVLEFLQYCKINDAAQQRVISFEFWSHILEVLHIIANETKVIILKSKQVGISYGLSLDTLHKALTVPSYLAIFLSAGERESAQLLEKPKFANAHLPDWLHLDYGKDSESEITFPRMGSGIIALPSTETPGIGMTASRVLMDEWDYHRYPESTYATAEAAVSAGGQMIGVSTIDKSKPDSLFKQIFRQARMGENGFYPIFLPYNCRPERDDVWYGQQRKLYIGREHHLEENYPTTEAEALSPMSARLFFDGDVLQRHLDNSLAPLEDRYGCTFIYSKYQASWAYGAGADVSQGVGADYQTLVILGKRGNTVEDVAYIHANDIPTKSYARYTEEICKDYAYPILAAESNAMGRSYLDELLELGYSNLYYRDRVRMLLGWHTGGDNREDALIDLAKAIADGLIVIRYKPVILQLMEFQRVETKDKGVKIKSVGKHDDLVMALAIAYQMIKDKRPPVGGEVVSPLVEIRSMGMYE